MKKILYLFLALAFLVSCDEIPPIINPITNQGNCPVVGESAVANQQRQILIEEFTGVRCVNCPAGSEAIENLINIHGDQLIAISIHADFFSQPYPQSVYDFRTTDGNGLLDLLGAPAGYPSAVVNRKLFSGEADLQLPVSLWASVIEQELNTPPAVKLAIKKEFDTTTRELEVQVSMFFEEDLSGKDVRLSVALIENNVDDYQLTPDGIEEFYKHKHIFRDMLTTFNGNPVIEQPTAGAQFCQSLTTTVSEDWDENNCELIAFVSLGGSDKDILQAHKVDLLDQ